MKNPNLPDLLRSIACGTNAQEARHDVIFNAAADEIAELRASNKQLLEALNLLVNDALTYEAWERPCFAVDRARAAIMNNRT